MVRALNILPGDRFGKLTCVKELDRRNGMRAWLVTCDCGNSVELLQKSFVTTKRKSCGCERRDTPHGLSNEPEYRHWINMISRCENPNTPGYEHYGGRGIKVCDRWRKSVENFYADMGPRPSALHSLDRVNVNGHYEPSNCRWALPKIQRRNTRSNHKVQINGWTMTLAEAAEKSLLPYNTILYRLKRGWSIENALSLPARKGHRP